MSEDRAALLARIADECMENGGSLPFLENFPGMTGLRAETYPHEQPREIHFAADWPGITLVAVRSLAGYSLEGGLHRIGQPSPSELLGRAQRGRRSR
jgi:hypothetical protein